MAAIGGISPKKLLKMSWMGGAIQNFAVAHASDVWNHLYFVQISLKLTKQLKISCVQRLKFSGVVEV